MRKTIVCLIALTIGSVQAQTLHECLKDFKWDVEKSGPLFAFAPDNLSHNRQDPNDQSPLKIEEFGMRTIKLGRLTAVVPKTRIQFLSNDYANPFDGMTESERFVAFLGSLNSSQWQQLTNSGLAPRNVSGLQRQLLESIIPHPLKAQEWIYNQDGSYGTEGDPIPVKPEIAQEVRLQLFKVLDVGRNAMVSVDGNAAMWTGTSSMLYRSPGTHVYRPVTDDKKAGDGGYSGRIVDNIEKPSQLNYKSPALAKEITPTGKTIAELFKQVRDDCGIEVYPDARLAKLGFELKGDRVVASDLLRAIALCIGGTYRQVASAYVLTYDIEGMATRSARFLAEAALIQIGIQSKTIGAREEIVSKHLLDQLDFLSDDPFHAKNFLAAMNYSASVGAEQPWVSRSVLNDVMQKAIPDVKPEPVLDPGGSGRINWVPDPKRTGQVHFNVTVGYRFLLPNGVVLESRGLDLKEGSTSYGTGVQQPIDLPLNSTKLREGCSVGFRTEDVELVKRFCAMAKDHGVKEIWIQTTSPQVIDACIASGLKVDLAVRPWEILKGEPRDPDLNVLGQTGAQLNSIEVARMDYARNQTWYFANSFSPQSSGLADHWNRLTALASNKGINRVVLLAPIADGYDNPEDRQYDRLHPGPFIRNGKEMAKNLKQFAPTVYEFGCTPAYRLAALRQVGIDPLDLEHPFRKAPFAPIPYFDEAPFGDYSFPRSMSNENDMLGAWKAFGKLRHEGVLSGLDQCLKRLTTAGHPIWLQYKPIQDDFYRSSLIFGTPESLHDRYSGDHDKAEMLSINPWTAEDANGAFDYSLTIQIDRPMCFDFSDVPASRLLYYFNHMFKVPKT